MNETPMNNPEARACETEKESYIQIGVTALRDPTTGDFLPSVPLYIRAEDRKKVSVPLFTGDETELAKVLAGKMKQYVDGCRAAGVKI